MNFSISPKTGKIQLLYIVAVIFLTLEFSCTKPLNSEMLEPGQEFVRIWALADIQPRNKKERDAFTKAVKDVNENISDVTFSILAGDIVNTTDEDTFDWYIEERNKSYIKDWYEIIGNHDLKPDKGKLFKEKIREEVNYSFTLDNLLFVFLSDEQRGKPTVISDETFQWWKKLVIDNQDKIITVVTHAPLEGSKIPFSENEDRQIKDSGRFRDVLEDYTVDLWLSGHLHLPNEFTNTINRNPKFENTLFVHISSIRPEFLGFKHSQSRIVEFLCGKDIVRIKSRDHESSKWNNQLQGDYKLSKIVECN